MYTHGGKYLKSLLKLIGAKTKIRDRLYQYFPSSYDSYYEPFGGTFGVLLGSPKVSYESANDLNSCTINFMTQLQSNPDRLLKELNSTMPKVLSDGFDFYSFRDNEPQEGTVESAAWFYVITKLSMNGIYRRNRDGKCNSSFCKTTRGRGFYTEEWFWKVYDRVKDVDFCNLDAREYISYSVPEKKDGVFLFLDPPYMDVLTTYNGKSYSSNDFAKLFSYLDATDNSWMLTINDHPYVRKALSDYYIIEHNVQYSCSQTAQGRQKAPELIITNYSDYRGNLLA